MNRLDLFFIFLLFFLLLSCSLDDKPKTIVLKSGYRNTDLNLLSDTILNLDNYKNLGEYRDAKFKIDRFNNYSTINMEVGNNNYIFNVDCLMLHCHVPPPVRSKNIIFIYQDSILKDESYGFGAIKLPIDSLEYLHKKDFFNCGKERNFSDFPSKLILSLQLEDSTSIKTTKGFLERIIKSYLKIDRDSIPLNITVSYWKIPKPPSLEEQN